jgi:hypothetical protein
VRVGEVTLLHCLGHRLDFFIRRALQSSQSFSDIEHFLPMASCSPLGAKLLHVAGLGLEEDVVDILHNGLHPDAEKTEVSRSSGVDPVLFASNFTSSF